MLIFAACALMIDALFGEKGVVAMMKAKQENQQLERRLAAAQAETRRLREDAYWLRRDPAAIEVLARQKLGLIKPGEKIFTIRDAPPSEQNVPPAGDR